VLLRCLYGQLDVKQRLLHAVSCNLPEQLTDVLTTTGSDVNATLTDSGGNTALHIAATKGFTECLRKLLAAGAHVDVTNHTGFTPVSLALRAGHTECARLFLATGSFYSDARLVWLDSSEMGRPMWARYTTDILELLLISTSNTNYLPPSHKQLFYDTFLRTGSNICLLKAFILSGLTITAAQLADLLHVLDGATSSWLQRYSQTVPPLQHCARICIRGKLTTNTLHSVPLLPLPHKLHKYLLLDDIR